MSLVSGKKIREAMEKGMAKLGIRTKLKSPNFGGRLWRRQTEHGKQASCVADSHDKGAEMDGQIQGMRSAREAEGNAHRHCARHELRSGDCVAST